MANPDKLSKSSTMLCRALRVSILGWDLVVPIVGAALLGHMLNDRYHTGSIVSMALLVLGVAVGTYNVWRQLQLEFTPSKPVTSQMRMQDGAE